MELVANERSHKDRMSLGWGISVGRAFQRDMTKGVGQSVGNRRTILCLFIHTNQSCNHICNEFG